MSDYGMFMAATILEGATSSAVVDLIRDYDYLSIVIPIMDECKLHLQVSETLGGTFYDLGKDTTTDLETFNRADVWLLGGWQYIKVVASNVQHSNRLIRVRGMRY